MIYTCMNSAKIVHNYSCDFLKAQVDWVTYEKSNSNDSFKVLRKITHKLTSFLIS